MTDVELKPCPFCGSCEFDVIDCSKGKYVVCKNCDTHGPDGLGAWNTRAPSPAAVMVDREAIAALEHEQWAHWTRHMLDNLTDENIDRWRRQIDTPYHALSEPEKDMDRVWADKVLALTPGQPTTEWTDAVQEAARVLLEDFDRIGCQKSPEPLAPWRDAFHAMNKDLHECGWTDWMSILHAALRALEGGE